MRILQRLLLTIGVVLMALAGVRASSSSARSVTIPDISKYEGRTIDSVEVVTEEAAPDSALEAELRALLRVAPGRRFSAVGIRESIQALWDSARVANVRVEAFDVPGTPGGEGRPRVRLRFVVRPQITVGAVLFDLGATTPAAAISEDELRARLNLLEPGRRVSETALRNNADAIQAYLRDRGYYRAEVKYDEQLDPTRTRETIVYRIAPGARTTVEDFRINIVGFDAVSVRGGLAIRPGAPFTQSALGEDVNRIRQAIIAGGNLAPRLDQPEIQLNQENNTILVTLNGSVGPKINVEVTGADIGEDELRALLPVKREGTIETSAIVEGARRLRNRFQEQGYFFVDVAYNCTVVPPLSNSNGATNGANALPQIPNGAGGTCDAINPDELSGRTIGLTYEITPGRRYKLTNIRIEGTEKLTVEDIEGDLQTKEANALGFIPVLGYGRGYTSDEALERDRRTILARMRDLGHPKAEVEARRGVSLEDDNLIITFAVTEGPLARVAGIELRGNQLFTAETLRRDGLCPTDRAPEENCTIVGGAHSPSQARADAERLRNFYARKGYVDAQVSLAFINLPDKDGDEQVRLIYTVNESDKVFINRIFVNGLVNTEKESVLRAIPLRQNEELRAADLAETERILYATDAFRQVIVRTELAGENSSGYKRRDIIIDVEERQRITTDYILGFSTDNGPLGGFEVRNNNLFGQLRQGALRSRASLRQQLLRLEYFDPRFRRYGINVFAPLAVSLQYQRDTNVTRFFRSTIDRGNFGIVQRLDEEGNPVDINCLNPDVSAPECRADGPSINRFTFNIETQRDLQLDLGSRGEVRKRTTLFLRYNYEDVRLFNTNSLLITDVLRPDRTVRLSRLGASLARDTRDRQLDATRGEFLTVDYALALKQLGGNISFSKLQTTYRRYYKINRVRETVFAGAVQLGLARIYDPSDRDDDGDIDGVDRTLPISERFFSGGSTTLRGFRFEEAGPRLAIVPNPNVKFFDSNGEQVTLNPFLVPVGGNALAVVNLEARVSVTKNLQVVPFYDGGNVFRRAGDIFKRDAEPGEDPNLRALWTHTAGLGFRVKTPLGPLSVDYGFLLNPPEFLLPQCPQCPGGVPPAIIRPKRGQFHFRFGQTF